MTAVSHQINDFPLRCTVYMLKTLLATISTAYLTEDNIRLIFDRVVLEDDRYLSYYDIIDGTRMHMFYRLRQAIPYFSPETSSDEDSD